MALPETPPLAPFSVKRDEGQFPYLAIHYELLRHRAEHRFLIIDVARRNT